MKKRMIKRSRKITLTSLIDVIFILLLFFLLTSTFNNYSEIEFMKSHSGKESTEEDIIFLKVSQEKISLNSKILEMTELKKQLLEKINKKKYIILLSIDEDTKSQRFIKMLYILESIKGINFDIIR